MAINPSTNATMVGRVTAPDANYTYGSSQDETAPGAGDGTPYFKARADDLFGLQQAILKACGIVPSGNADTQLVSEYLQGIVEIASGRAYNYDDSGVADAYVLAAQTNQQTPRSLFDGQIFEFIVANTNTGASTVDLLGLGGGVKNIVNTAGGGELTATLRVRLRYRLGSDDCEIVSITAFPYIKLTETQASAVDGGTFTLGSWVTRTLNTEDFDTGGHCSLAANRFTLDAGTYKIRAIVPASGVNEHKAKLVKDPAGSPSDELIGISAYSSGNVGARSQTSSDIVGQFTIGASTTFEIQHRCGTTATITGLGRATSLGISEVYTTVELEKVA